MMIPISKLIGAKSIWEISLIISEVNQKYADCERPFVTVDVNEKVLVIYCSDALYKFINDLDALSEKDFNIVTMGRLWRELRTILRKGIKK